MRPALSIITTTDPVAGQLPALLQALSLQAEQASSYYEVVIVDDLSLWRAPGKPVLPPYPNLFLRPLTPKRRRGQQHALLKGVFIARAPFVLTIDPDLYRCIDDIPVMMGMINDQCWAVHGVRTRRDDMTAVRRLGSMLANTSSALITGLDVPDIGSPVTLFSRRAIATLPQPNVKAGHVRLHSYLLLGDKLAFHLLRDGSPAHAKSQYSFLMLASLFLRLIWDSLMMRLDIVRRLKAPK